MAQGLLSLVAQRIVHDDRYTEQNTKIKGEKIDNHTYILGIHLSLIHI